jgi:hypothetical protein
MRKFSIVILALVLMCPALLCAVGADHPKEPVHNEQWPKVLDELVNVFNRVHGYFVNWEDVFFFRGDTAAVNAFLAKYSQLGNARLLVVLHAGKLEVKSPWDKQPRDLMADWQLYAAPFTPEQVKPGDAVKPGPFVTRVDICLGGSIKLDQLEVPQNVLVESGGEIDSFVQRHEHGK